MVRASAAKFTLHFAILKSFKAQLEEKDSKVARTKKRMEKDKEEEKEKNKEEEKKEEEKEGGGGKQAGEGED
ncbi:hypothetical protein M8J77_013630 [Diaphorina citri]|nr:hypothetical protein M8J77_013630 [Diaphorina citri]